VRYCTVMLLSELIEADVIDSSYLYLLLVFGVFVLVGTS
jgi:hypothetical protein